MRRRAGLLLAAPILAGALLLVLPACATIANDSIFTRHRNDRDLFAGVRTGVDCILSGWICMVIDLPLSFVFDLLMLPATIRAQVEDPTKAVEPAEPGTP